MSSTHSFSHSSLPSTSSHSSSPASPSSPSSSPPSPPSSSSSSPSTPTHSTTTSTPIAPIAATVVVITVVILISVAAFFFFRRRIRPRARIHGHVPDKNSEAGGGHISYSDYDSSTSRSQRSRKPAAVDRNHVAARITPFGSSANLVPHYDRSPGFDMRIATRRPDGAWEFSTPGAPFNPSGVDDIEPPASLSLISASSSSTPTQTPTRAVFSSSSSTTMFSEATSSSAPSTPPRKPITPIRALPNPPSLSSLPNTPNTPSGSSTFSTSSLEPPKSPAQLMKERESKAARLIRKGYDDREFSDELPPPAYGQEPCYLDHVSQPRFS